MVRIKLCGLTRECDIENVNILQPEYIGFIFWKKSKRYVDPEKASKLKALLDPGIKVAGVFVDEEMDTVLHLVENDVIDVIQLHGNEDEDYIKEIKSKTNAPVIKAFSMDLFENVEKANASSADYVLLDSGRGGTGIVFDWELAKMVKRDFFLAGGLNPSNVCEGIERLNPYAVDVSSGIETDSLKDFDKMSRFVMNVKGVKQ